MEVLDLSLHLYLIDWNNKIIILYPILLSILALLKRPIVFIAMFLNCE